MPRAPRGPSSALLFLDLTAFKDVNDSLGHATGDRILRMAAHRLQQAAGAQHTVARIGGDEFTVLLEDLASPAEPMPVRSACSMPSTSRCGWTTARRS